MCGNRPDDDRYKGQIAGANDGAQHVVIAVGAEQNDDGNAIKHEGNKENQKAAGRDIQERGQWIQEKKGYRRGDDVTNTIDPESDLAS